MRAGGCLPLGALWREWSRLAKVTCPGSSGAACVRWREPEESGVRTC